MRADRNPGLQAVGEVLALQHLLQRCLAKQAQHVRRRKLRQPFGVGVHLGALAIEDEEDLIEVRLRVAVDLLAREHGSCLGTAARVADHRRVVADDEHHRMPMFLKGPKHVEHDQVAYVYVGRRRIHTQLHAQLAASGQP